MQSYSAIQFDVCLFGTAVLYAAQTARCILPGQ